MYFKNAIATSDSKMSELIMGNAYILLLIEHFGIQLPFQDKTINEVCEQNNINTELFLTFANLYNGIKYKSQTSFHYKESYTIVGYLRNSHNYYSEEIYPSILRIIKDMHNANDFKEMELVEKFFIEYFNEVKEHLDYENNIVFPYIIKLYEQIKHKKLPEYIINYSVKEYKEHHNDIEEKLNDFKNLLVKYLPLQNDQFFRRKLLFRLNELEFDLSIHSQIEDLILIPLVAEMELQIKKQK
jgi:regulator of cell morphogenesis and NO signaling